MSDDHVLAIIIPSALWQRFCEQAHMLHSESAREGKAESILIDNFNEYVVKQQMYDGPFFALDGVVYEDKGNGYSIPARGEGTRLDKEMKSYDIHNARRRARDRNYEWNSDCIAIEKKGLII